MPQTPTLGTGAIPSIPVTGSTIGSDPGTTGIPGSPGPSTVEDALAALQAEIDALSPGSGDATSIRGVAVDIDAATPANHDVLLYSTALTAWIAQHVEADDVNFNETITGILASTTVQNAIDELATLVAGPPFSLGSLGATASPDRADGEWQYGTLTDDTAITFVGVAGLGTQAIQLELAEGAGGFTPSFTNLTFLGTAPTWDTTASTSTIVLAMSRDGGTTWIGGVLGGSGGGTSGRWELAVITGSPPDPLYAGGDYLYILVP